MSVTAHDNIAVCNTLCDGPDTKYTIIDIIDGQIHIMCRSVRVGTICIILTLVPRWCFL